jgi:hypothetical protein
LRLCPSRGVFPLKEDDTDHFCPTRSAGIATGKHPSNLHTPTEEAWSRNILFPNAEVVNPLLRSLSASKDTIIKG